MAGDFENIGGHGEGGTGEVIHVLEGSTVGFVAEAEAFEGVDVSVYFVEELGEGER